jgi:MFS family permease
MQHRETTMEKDQKAITWRDLLFGARARIMWTITVGITIQAFGWFLVATIMPSVVLQLGKPQLLSWGTTAFLALSIPGSASAGYLKGRFGTKRLLIIAALLVILANSFGLVAPNMEVFLLARAVQGLGEGMIVALCYILIGDNLEPQEMPPAFAIVAVVWALATLIGPSLAGILTGLFNWRIAFVPLLVLAGTLLILVATERRPLQKKNGQSNRLPLDRLVIMALAIGCVSVAGAIGHLRIAAVLVVVALALLGCCFRIDRRSENRLFPRNLLSLSHPSTLGVWIIGSMFGADAGPPIFMAYFVQLGHGTSVFFAGQFAAITALAWSVSAIFASRIRRQNGRAMLIVGPACLMTGLGILMFWSYLPLAVSGIALILIGFGFGLSYGFFMEYALATAPAEDRDVTSGAIPTFESICSAVGGAVSGLLGNAAGFGGFGAHDIPPSVPMTVFGVAVIAAFFILLGAIRFFRLVRQEPQTMR